MRISPHFTMNEMTASRTADIRGIDNTPTADQERNLIWSAWRMEIVRVLLGGKPIIVTSAFRSVSLNQAVGGVAHSDHVKGLAVDFRQHGKSPKAIADIIRGSALDFDQCIFYNSFVHLGFGKDMRRQVFNG